MFKSLVFSVFLFVTVFCGNPTNISEKSLMTLMFKLFEHATPCAQKYNLTEQDIHSFKRLQFPAGEHNKCFAKCTLNSLDMMKDGKYTPAPASKHVQKLVENKDDGETFSKFMMSCESVNDLKVSDGDEGCDRAFNVFECLKENAPKMLSRKQ